MTLSGCRRSNYFAARDSFYSITSSASASTVTGSSRPSTLAALRLITGCAHRQIGRLFALEDAAEVVADIAKSMFVTQTYVRQSRWRKKRGAPRRSLFTGRGAQLVQTLDLAAIRLHAQRPNTRTAGGGQPTSRLPSRHPRHRRMIV
jgi:hypothetical protein